MRKLINEKNILIGIIGAILDSLAIYVADSLGLPFWAALIVGYMPSMLGNGLITKGVDALRRISAELAAGVIFFGLAVISGILWKYLDVDVWKNLPWYVVPGLIGSVISIIVAQYKWNKSQERVLRNFETMNGTLEDGMEEARKKAEALKGVNREISGDYDRENAVCCENGIFVGKNTEGVKVFKGIPYALPPVGERRWKAPQKVESSQKVFEAFYYGNAAPQPCHVYSEASLYKQDEDCLTLNIWKSEEHKEQGPVLVWIDTLDWCVGGTASTILDGAAFVKENPDILFVSINFRLGLLGNMDFSGIPGGEDYADSRNLGLQDQAEALRWIHRNIEAFGGDTDNVTILGVSGGGTAAALLCVMPEARGLFSKAVSIGGSVWMTNEQQEYETYQKKIREILHADTMEDYLSLPPEKLVEAVTGSGRKDAVLPVRDAKTVPEDLKAAFGSGKASGVSLLFSLAKQENMFLYAMEDRESAEKQLKKEIEKRLSALTEEQTWYLKQYLKLYYGSSSAQMYINEEFLTELFGHYPMLGICRAHAKTGGSSRYLVWRFESPVEEIGASSLIPALMILGNEENSEKCGVVSDPAAFKAVRKTLVNFLRTGDPSFRNGDIEGFSEVEWLPYGQKDESVMVADEYGWRPDGGQLSERMTRLTMLDNTLYR